MVSRSRVIHSRTSQVGATLAAAWLALLAGCEDAPVADEPSVRPVRYARVAAQGNTESRTYSGSARAELETDLSFRVGGTLTSRPVNVGNELGRGDLVAALDNTDYQVQLNEARAGLARAEAEQRNADASYKRTRDLYENQNASRTQLDSARAMAESAEAQYRAASQQVEAARLQLSYTRLTAPQQCTVAQTFAEINQNVSAGQAVVRLNCGHCAEVEVSVPDTDIAKVREGMAVTASISAVTDGQLPGIVQEVGIATGARGTTYAVTVGLQEKCENVRSGMAVDVTFQFLTTGGDGNLIVPYVAVGEDRNGNFVFVLEPDADGRIFANRRAVEIGAAASDGIVVTNGLAVGELIATAGVRRLSPGQQVTLLGDPDATAL
jgi:RND family efflux transporter MFP subunit